LKLVSPSELFRSKKVAQRRNRVPPGQKVVKGYPVLHYNGVPRVTLSEWRLSISGEVARDITLTWDEFSALTQARVVADTHCVTGWSSLGDVWEGVLFNTVFSLVEPLPDANYCMVHSLDGYTTNLPLAVLCDDDVIFATRMNGRELTPEHGWPVRLVVPKRYLWKSAKWVNGIEFMRENEPGFWESRGYHMEGDPWKEERYSGHFDRN